MVGSCLALLFALLVAPGAAFADEPVVTPPLRWKPGWTHAGPLDYTLAGFGATTLVLQTIYLQPQQAAVRFQGPLLFDASARSFLRGSTWDIRTGAADVSWIFWALDVAYPFVTDVPYAWARYGPGVAWDLFWQDSVALLLASSFDLALRDVVGRVRPNDSDCLAQGKRSDCVNPESVRSFPSGHFVEATTGASLICTQHLSLHLYGGPWDDVTCATAAASAVTVGVLRLVADNHWTTDVIGSGALGVLFGWGVPYVMHLHGSPLRPPANGAPALLVLPTPIAVDHGGGIGLTGIF